MLVVLLLVIGAVGDFWRAAHVTRVRLPAASAAGIVAPPGPGGGRSGVDGAGRGEPPVPSPAAPASVDLNRASVRELDALPGIGPVLAERIVEHRRSHGPFRNADELLAVRGIGPKLYARLLPFVTATAGEPARVPATGGPRSR